MAVERDVRFVPADEELEVVIAAICQLMLRTEESRVQRVYVRTIAWLIAKRSPEQVERMERRMGISDA